MKVYALSEIFYSLQGEGGRAGCPSTFIRFAGCNLSCTVGTRGFDCDTDLGMRMSATADVLIDEIRRVSPLCDWLVLTGGEPTLQLDEELIIKLKKQGYKLAVETNGTNKVPAGFDWISVSPKPGVPIKQTRATEVKYVIPYGGSIPHVEIEAEHYFLSPAFEGDQPEPGALDHCIQLCLANPVFRLSVQQHKGWRIR